MDTQLFQHTAARGRLTNIAISMGINFLFQHTAARGRLKYLRLLVLLNLMFQHTAARGRLSTRLNLLLPCQRFNTQPPEGG